MCGVVSGWGRFMESVSKAAGLAVVAEAAVVTVTGSLSSSRMAGTAAAVRTREDGEETSGEDLLKGGGLVTH